MAAHPGSRMRLAPVFALLALAACGGEEGPLLSTPIDTPTIVFDPYVPNVDTGHPYDVDTDTSDTDS